MIATRDELIDAALELPEEDRAEIARRLRDSLSDEFDSRLSIAPEDAQTGIPNCVNVSMKSIAVSRS